MANKKDNQPRPLFKKTAAEMLLESSLSPAPKSIDEQEEQLIRQKKELKKATGYYLIRNMG